jgi:hypothetical protein
MIKVLLTHRLKPNPRLNNLEEKKAENTTNHKLVVESVFDFNFFDILESEEDDDKPIGGWGERGKVIEKPKPEVEPKKEPAKVSKPDSKIKDESPLLTYMAKKYPKTKNPGRSSYAKMDKEASKNVRKQQRKYATDDELLKRSYYKQHKGDPNRVGFQRRTPHTTPFVGYTLSKGTPQIDFISFETLLKKK